MNEITELEQMVEEEEIESAPDNSALSMSKAAYSIAVVILDIVTGWTIWQLTFWYYGLLWFMAGAVVFYLHQKNWERVGNNEKQTRVSITGLIVSVVSMLIMAVAAGSLWIANTRGASINIMWSEIGIVGTTIALYAWHAVMLARYYFSDDSFVIRNLVARAKAQANKKVEIIKAGGAVVQANKNALLERDSQYKRHGDRGAVDRSIARIEGKRLQAPAPKLSDNSEKGKWTEEESAEWLLQVLKDNAERQGVTFKENGQTTDPTKPPRS